MEVPFDFGCKVSIRFVKSRIMIHDSDYYFIRNLNLYCRQEFLHDYEIRIVTEYSYSGYWSYKYEIVMRKQSILYSYLRKYHM